MGIRWDEIVAMPRPWRVQYPGAIYHLMSRGDHREPTFRDDNDRRRSHFAERGCVRRTSRSA